MQGKTTEGKHPDQDTDELTPEDRAWIRQKRRQDAHEEWLRGQVRVLWPWVVTVIGAIVAIASWVKDHVKL